MNKKNNIQRAGVTISMEEFSGEHGYGHSHIYKEKKTFQIKLLLINNNKRAKLKGASGDIVKQTTSL
jgi:hypothetical protein